VAFANPEVRPARRALSKLRQFAAIGGLVAIAQPAAAGKAEDVKIISDAISDDVASLMDYEEASSRREAVLDNVIDVSTDCDSIKILVKSIVKPDHIVYDIPVARATLRWNEESDKTQSEFIRYSNVIFSCIGDTSCIKMSSPEGNITWGGAKVKRTSGMALYDAKGSMYPRLHKHFDLLKKVCA
jgi:hypothetical protein